jgi:DNA-binding XRE family transcriptional regulator
MKTRPFREIIDPIKADPLRRERIEANKRAMRDALTLARLREHRGLTQAAVAQSLDQTQANVSRIEHEEDLYLSTLRGYIAALGGSLEVTAVFDDERIVLDASGR